MENLPKNWVSVVMEDLGAQKYYAIGDGDHGKIKPAMYQEFGVPYIRVGDMGWGEFKTNKLVYIPFTVHEENLKSELLPGDVLIAKTGATIGKCCIVPEDIEKANTTSSVGKVSLNQNLTSSKFILYYFLSPSFFKLMWSHSNRTAQPGFNNRDLKKFPVPLPPLAEQQRIVAKLDTLFGHLDRLKQRLEHIPALLKQFRQSVLTQAVTGKLTEEWREGKGLDKGEKKTLGELARVVRGGSPRPAGDPRFYGGKYPFIKVKDITKDKEMYLQSYENTVTKLGLNKTRLIPADTVILSNSGATLGVPKITPYEITANDGVAAFLELKYCLKEYLYFCLTSQTESFRAIKKGAAQPNLNTDIIRNWSIFLPALKEQTEIVQRVEALFTKADSIEASYQNLKQQIDNLPQAILAKAFKGELVEQLPTDGDAKELLKEIAALRASLEKEKKSKKKKKVNA